MSLRDEDIVVTTVFYTESGVTFSVISVIITKHLPTETSIAVEPGSLAEIKETLARKVLNLAWACKSEEVEKVTNYGI